MHSTSKTTGYYFVALIQEHGQGQQHVERGDKRRDHSPGVQIGFFSANASSVRSFIRVQIFLSFTDGFFCCTRSWKECTRLIHRAFLFVNARCRRCCRCLISLRQSDMASWLVPIDQSWLLLCLLFFNCRGKVTNSTGFRKEKEEEGGKKEKKKCVQGKSRRIKIDSSWKWGCCVRRKESQEIDSFNTSSSSSSGLSSQITRIELFYQTACSSTQAVHV